jgi:NitT/TauT family transport system ATP-binding protein
MKLKNIVNCFWTTPDKNISNRTSSQENAPAIIKEESYPEKPIVEIKQKLLSNVQNSKINNLLPKQTKTSELVVFENVTKKFGNKVAIQDVSFIVHDIPNKGELITIVGQSGCGKSTLLKILAGLEPHFPQTSGKVIVFGNKLEKPSAERGLVDQKYSLLPNLTVIDNIAFGLMLRNIGKKDRREQAMEWVKKVDLEGSEKKYPHELSGGMQQRVSIASTLILKPRILLMDEPFGALDPKIRLQMQELLIKLWEEQETTVFFVTHSVEEAVYLGDRIYRMSPNPGRLVEIIETPRPDKMAWQVRNENWFIEATRNLLHKLEENTNGN